MATEPMTLIERLENPEWARSPDPRDGPYLKTGLTVETMGMAAAEIKRLRMDIVDLKVLRIMEMTDEQVLADCLAEGRDPVKVSEEMKALFERAIARAMMAPTPPETPHDN